MSGHAKMPPASHQVSATSLKLLIQQIQLHVRVDRDSGMCVARDLYELWAGDPTPACLWPARRTRSRRSSYVIHDTAPIPGIVIPGARGKDLHPRSSCQRVEECSSAFFRLILRPMSKPGGALPARYTHCCICACPCSACCGFCSLLWGEY